MLTLKVTPLVTSICNVPVKDDAVRRAAGSGDLEGRGHVRLSDSVVSASAQK
jgi:hypothetical protein